MLRRAGQPEPAARDERGRQQPQYPGGEEQSEGEQSAGEIAGGDDGQRGAQPVLGPGELQRSGAQKLYDGNQKQVEIGALPAIEVTRAAAEVSASKEDLLIAQTNLAQQEIVLKNALNRNSMQNVWLDDVHIIPLDHIEVPKTEEIRPVADLIQEAVESRLEI